MIQTPDILRAPAIAAWHLPSLPASLLTTLLVIALVDSINPSVTCVHLLLLATPAPAKRGAAFLIGVFFANLLGGMLLLAGAGRFLAPTEQAKAAAAIATLLAAVALLAAAFFLPRHAPAAEQVLRRLRTAPAALGAATAFLVGSIMTIIEMPTAAPYFAAVERLLSPQCPPQARLGLLVCYNAVFVIPLALLLTTRLLLPIPRSESGQDFTAPISAFLREKAIPLLRALLLSLGLLFSHTA